MDVIRKQGATDNLLRVKIHSSVTGAGLTGLSPASVGLAISTIADVEAAATVYTAAASNLEAITTLGAFAAPSATCIRFGEVDSTHHPGLYEIHFDDARFAVADSRGLHVTLYGATGMAETEIDVRLTALDLDSATVDLGAAGLDAVAIETGIVASADVVDDLGTQLTEINARQALAAMLAALAGRILDAETPTVAVQAAGLPVVQRILADVDITGRTAVALTLPA